MENMIRNPNLTSSHLFRAEIFYDSQNDVSVQPDAVAPDVDHVDGSNGTQSGNHEEDDIAEGFSKFTKHMREEYRPRRLPCRPAGYEWKRTWVRRLVPRNPQLDRDLVQTCHLFKNSGRSTPNTVGDPTSIQPEMSPEVSAPCGEGDEETIVFYIPHVRDAEDLPWYHPSVRSIAFQHLYNTSSPGTLLIHCRPFPSESAEIPTRLQRTALKILETIHKHANGHATGYEKRVHHDVVVPQGPMQDTYTRLKAKYAKSLIGDWVEHTDPAKHVFEDLAIAAFLMELWRDMYGIDTDALPEGKLRTRTRTPSTQLPGDDSKEFPGFVDIGCGNGVLVHVLISEGYQGWGFDIRKRKTWKTFPANVQENLKEMILVPEIYMAATKRSKIPTHSDTATETRYMQGDSTENGADSADSVLEAAISEFKIEDESDVVFHNGTFPQGTFIISNHADELTAWTPLLALLSSSPFIAIPCCSHNFDGRRFRAPGPAKDREAPNREKSNPQSGSLKPGKAGQLSAYAALCGWVERLTSEVGYETEKEMLRIPSTRNACLLGRKISASSDSRNQLMTFQERCDIVKVIVERELKTTAETAGLEWLERTNKILTSKGSAH
jgi:tRNASer (uridine44-2'-O)-methyltransferase